MALKRMGGMAKYSPTSCLISTRGFVGRRGSPEPRNVALPGHRGCASEPNVASSDEQESEDDSDDVEAIERKCGGSCVDFETENSQYV